VSTAVSRPPAAYVPGGGEAWRSPWTGLAALRDQDPVHHVVPERRPDADRLDVHRSPSQILTFGQGGHHCLGNAAARMQVRVALEELLARIPHFGVDVEGITWADGPYVRRPLTVPFEVVR